MSPQGVVDGGAGATGWLLEHGAAAFWGIVALAVVVVLLRVGYTVVLAWTDLRLRWRGGDALGAATDWLGARGPDGRSGLYHAYMHSGAWAARRERTLMLAGGVCQRCGARASDAHHKTYTRLGYERDADLEALCADCHARAHGRG